ncbi:MAG: nucleotidyltransferase domain-containing protein [Gemmatimonadetes bacterium]|nr:nucleotidyltransferase domain-containing protein [Gemmatimonadota bacterium]MYB68819.1 nucleotidyltransferase domain-containing protein [Gemmatimonadota bacterium]
MMTERLDLPRRYRDQIEALLREHMPGVEVWAYGSRVNGRSHEGSDLDLVLRGPDLQRIDSGQLADLIEALEESNVPIIVQTHDWARLPERFQREIEREYVVLVGQERKE